jgi:DNA-binding response OmpR family regulator
MPNTGQYSVLIADDDRDLVEALTVRCRGLGLGVYTAYDAFTALSIVRTRRPDLACLDVEMPAGNGLSVCEMLATDKECAAMPVIILTGKCDSDTIRRCHSLCVYYVEKCADVWPRIEPLLREHFKITTNASSVPTVATNEVSDVKASVRGTTE